VPVQELVQFGQVVTDNSISLDVASEGMRFMADAMQGLGISGQEAGDIFSVLVQKGASIDVVKQKLNNLAEIDSRLQGMGLADFAKKLPQLMEVSEVTVDNIEDMYVSILTLNNGASSKQALTQYTAAMQNFAESRNEIRRNLKGFDVKDQNGELKSFEEIMTALIERGKEMGGFDRFKDMFKFSDNTIKAIKQFNNYSEETKEKIADLGDTSNAVSSRAEQNALSLKSNLVSLQDNILKLSDAAMTKPIAFFAKLLDAHPKGMEMAIYGVGGALLALSAMKAFSTVVNLITSMKGLKGGKIGADFSGSKIGAELSGGAVVPVYVTNAESMGGGLPGQGNPLGGGQGSPSRPGGAKGLFSADTITTGLGIFAVTKTIYDNILLPIAQKAHAEMEEKGIDPAVPGVNNYYNLNPKIRKKLWEEYHASHPEEPLPKGAPISAAGDAPPADSSPRQQQKKPKAGSYYWGGGFEVPATQQAAQAKMPEGPAMGTLANPQPMQRRGIREPEQTAFEIAKQKWQMQAGLEMPSTRQAFQAITNNDSPEQQQKKLKTGSYWGGIRDTEALRQAGLAKTPEETAIETAKKTLRFQGGSLEMPSMRQPGFAAHNGSAEQPERKQNAPSFLRGFEMPSMRQPGFAAHNGSPGQPQKKQNAGTFLGGFKMPSMKPPSQIRIPESALPPKIARAETAIAPAAKARLEGNATLEVNVNISGERPTANVAVKSNNTPLNFHPTGNAKLARILAT